MGELKYLWIAVRMVNPVQIASRPRFLSGAVSSSRLLKKPHMPIALSIVEGCAQSPRYDVRLCENSKGGKIFLHVGLERM
jgi:hypothetical protein